MTLCLIKIILNVYKYQRYKYARRVNNVFENDPDRVMTFEKLANALHLPKDTVKKDVLWLIDNGVITNCRFDDNNPDLIYEMNKHLEILFEDQKSSGIYASLMNDINSIAVGARSLDKDGYSTAQYYVSMKKKEYEYLDALKSYVPKLLEKEDFFSSVFN